MKLNERIAITTTVLIFLLICVAPSIAEWGETARDFIRLPLMSDAEICSDGNGGCWVASSPVGLCHVDRSGNVTWGDTALIIPPARSYDPRPVLADNGDVILAMETYNNEEDRQRVYLQRFNLDGEYVWGEEGINLDTSRLNQHLAGAYPGPVDDTYLIHWDRAGEDNHPLIQLINGDGESLWGVGGFELNWTHSNSHFALTSDQCYIVAQNVPDTPAIEIIKIDPDGEFLWDLRLSTLAENIRQRSLRGAESDRLGGAVLIYEYERRITIDNVLRRYYGINAIRVSDEGDSLWTTHLYEREKEPQGDRYGEIDPIINYAGSGRFFVAWADNAHTFQAAAFDVEGELFWEEPVDVITSDVGYTTLAAVDSDGAVCYIWRQIDDPHMGGRPQQWGQRISLDGERLWGDHGRAVQARNVSGRSIVTDGNGGMITVVDGFPTIQMMNRNGEIGVVLEVGIDGNFDKLDPKKLSPHLHIYPNPANSMTTLSFSRPFNQNMTLKFYDLQGRLLLNNLIHPGVSAHPLDISTFPTGNYILQTKSGKTTSSQTLQILK